MPTGASHVNLSMAILCAAGGVMGAVKKGSKASLIAGLAFGGLYGGSVYLINNGKADSGFALGFASSMMLTGSMGQRYLVSKKVMPAGVMAAAGLFATLHNAYQYNAYFM